jgi:hypothetical protein
VFYIAEKASEFLLKTVTLVSSAKKMDFDKVFIVGGRSFIYNIKSKGAKALKLPLGNSIFYCSPF